MATFDNSYSRFIAWAKIVLPLLALGLLSTLFLFSRGIDPSQTIPYADVDIEELAREPRLTAPNYSGVTDDGAALSIFADTVRPDSTGSGRITAQTLRAAIETPDGLVVDIVSDTGTLDGAGRMATLDGGATLQTSTGYRIETRTLMTALDGTLVESEGAVVASGPLGTVDAGQMVLEREGDTSDSYLLVFKNGVKLVYTPQD